jgi:NAD(P)-dependent dehydrogenase (short-subunit alcohol dehydrogenase family)
MTGVMIVTGGSRGIGAAIAKLAGQRGYAVAVNYASRPDAAEAVVQEINRANGRAIAIKADVGNEREVEAMFKTVDKELGPVTALVNNAGVLGPVKPITEIGGAEVNALLQTNITSMLLCAREAVRRMSTQMGGKGGAIVNISSVAARTGGMPKNVPYAASKAAADALTIGLAKEVAQQGIRVNAIRPGLIVTDIHHAHGGDVHAIAQAGAPIGRAADPREVATCALWLLSDEASYVTGSIYDVAGGR